MRTIRFPIAGLMGAVLVIALSLAALRNASEICAGVTFLMTCGVLGLAIVGVSCRAGGERAWWLGFALFGWGYLVHAFWSPFGLPTMALLDAIASRLGMEVRFSVGRMGGAQGAGGGRFGWPNEELREIAHSLWALVAALVGGLLARTLFGGSMACANALVSHSPIIDPAPRRWWIWPAILGLTASGAIVTFGFLWSRLSPELWVGATFLVTCGVLGIAVLGAAGDQGKRQQVWRGAAIFGIAYLTVAFVQSLDGERWFILPTDNMLRAIRHMFLPVEYEFATGPDATPATNARIWRRLEQPVPVHFSDDTQLGVVLKFIAAATRGPDGKGIPIYVSPIGLQEAEKSMTSTVRNLDLEGIPLKTSLRLCLDQLDLTYRIRDGFLLITSKENAMGPVNQDPFSIVGHCLLAVLAAGFGGFVALLFCFKPTEHAAP